MIANVDCEMASCLVERPYAGFIATGLRNSLRRVKQFEGGPLKGPYKALKGSIRAVWREYRAFLEGALCFFWPYLAFLALDW